MSICTGKALWLVAGALTVAVGCAHTPERETQEDLQRTIASLRAQNAAYMRQIEELENQVFILSDKAESEQINAQRVATPELPRVKLHPEADVARPVVNDDSQLQAVYESDVPGQGPIDVEYAGEATRRSANRPVLRLVGNSGGISVGDEKVAVASPEPPRLAVARGEQKQKGDSMSTAPAPDSAPVQKPRKVGIANEGTGRHAPLDLYRGSMAYLTGGQHADAAAGFRDFLRRFPTHDYADNAQYWLGECYYDLKDYTSAVREFRRVVQDYPNGNKVPDALLKAGFAYQAMGQMEASRKTLEELRRTYPQHPTAQLAADRLSELSAKEAQGKTVAGP